MVSYFSSLLKLLNSDTFESGDLDKARALSRRWQAHYRLSDKQLQAVLTQFTSELFYTVKKKQVSREAAECMLDRLMKKSGFRMPAQVRATKHLLSIMLIHQKHFSKLDIAS